MTSRATHTSKNGREYESAFTHDTFYSFAFVWIGFGIAELVAFVSHAQNLRHRPETIVLQLFMR